MAPCPVHLDNKLVISRPVDPDATFMTDPAEGTRP